MRRRMLPRPRSHRRVPRHSLSTIPMGSKLYVGNLNFTTTEDALKTAFAANGRTVREVAILSDRETQEMTCEVPIRPTPS